MTTEPQHTPDELDELKHIEELIVIYGKLPTNGNKRRIMHLIAAHYARQEAEILAALEKQAETFVRVEVKNGGRTTIHDTNGVILAVPLTEIRKQLTSQAEQERKDV